jgi:pimeloyl-ACP methyl ester carboxylesterase
VPESLVKKIDLSYFRVPVATGTGLAVYARGLQQPSMETKKSDAHSSQALEKPLIILLHGLADDCVYPFWHWMDHFTQQGFQVLSVEWDGHGNSGASHLDFQSATRTIPLLLQKLCSEPGRGIFSHLKKSPPVYLVGHSTGATLALIAATRPEISAIVTTVFAISPVLSKVHSLSYRNQEKWGFYNPMSWIRDFGARVSVYGFSGLQGFSGLGSRPLPVRPALGLPLEEQLNAFLEETFEERKILKKVQSQVVWIHGAKDRFSPYQNALRLMEEIPGQLERHIEPKRTHLSLAFSAVAPKYVTQFIQNQLAQQTANVKGAS